MKNHRLQSIVLAVSTLLFLGSIGLHISIDFADNHTKENTTRFSATVDSIQVTNTRNKVYAEIHTKEFCTTLQISTNITKHISVDDVQRLLPGQSVFFSVQNTKVDHINEVEFIEIVSLETEAKTIFSLQDYNQIIAKAVYPAKVATVVLASVFLLLSLFSFISVTKKRIRVERTE